MMYLFNYLLNVTFPYLRRRHDDFLDKFLEYVGFPATVTIPQFWWVCVLYRKFNLKQETSPSGLLAYFGVILSAKQEIPGSNPGHSIYFVVDHKYFVPELWMSSVYLSMHMYLSIIYIS